MQESLLHHSVLGIKQQLLCFLLLARRKEHFHVLFSVPPLGLDCSQDSLCPLFLNLFAAFLNGKRGEIEGPVVVLLLLTQLSFTSTLNSN